VLDPSFKSTTFYTDISLRRKKLKKIIDSINESKKLLNKIIEAADKISQSSRKGSANWITISSSLHEIIFKSNRKDKLKRILDKI
jgi:hypothetical protein